MSSKDRRNRVRWTANQRQTARGRMAKQITAEIAEKEANRLPQLRELAEMLEQFPHMADTLARVRAEIERIK